MRKIQIIGCIMFLLFYNSCKEEIKYLYFNNLTYNYCIDRKCSHTKKGATFITYELSTIIDQSIPSNLCPYCVSEKQYDLIKKRLKYNIQEKNEYREKYVRSLEDKYRLINGLEGVFIVYSSSFSLIEKTKITEFYNNLINSQRIEGKNIETLDHFESYFKDEESMQILYEKLNRYFTEEEIGTYAEFRKVFFGDFKTNTKFKELIADSNKLERTYKLLIKYGFLGGKEASFNTFKNELFNPILFHENNRVYRIDTSQELPLTEGLYAVKREDDECFRNIAKWENLHPVKYYLYDFVGEKYCVSELERVRFLEKHPFAHLVKSFD